MLETGDQLAQIEISIEGAQRNVKRRDALYRLFDNSDFQEIITTGYLEQEAVRLVHLKADPEMQVQEKQIDVLNAIDAIGYLKQHFQAIIAMGNGAENAIKAHEETRAEILKEAH